MSQKFQRTVFILAALALALDIFGLYIPAKFGTCWLVIPDALENAFCADNFLREGKYGFYLNGVLYPSRYLPWFPLLFLAPFQALTGDVYGAVYGSWFAAAGLAAVMFLSCRQTTVRPGPAGARDAACSGLLNNMKLFTTRIFSSVSLIFVLIINSWKLSIVAIIVLLAALYPLTTLRKKITDIMSKTVSSSSGIITFFSEAFSGNRVITSYNLYDYFY